MNLPRKESVTLFGAQFPLIVTTAVPKGSLSLVTTPRNEDTSALQLAMHDFEKSYFHQKNNMLGKVASPEKLSVVEVTKRIRLGKRQYLLGMTIDVSGAKPRVISRQTISLDGALIKNLGTKLVTEGRSV